MGNKRGKDQVDIETLKARDETNAKQLAKLYRKCITERCIPNTWKEANIQRKWKCREYNIPLCVAFVYYDNAFDSVQTKAILASLQEKGIEDVYIEIRKYIYPYIAQCDFKVTNRVPLFQNS